MKRYLFALLSAVLLLLATARSAITAQSREVAGMAIGAAGTLASLLVVIYTGVYIEGLTALAAWAAVGIGIAPFVTTRRATAVANAPA